MSVVPVFKTSGPKGGRAFSLVELLVVIAIVAILASLILPALARAKAKAQASFCVNNSRQLAVAWVMYSDEHNGSLVYNLGRSPRISVAAPAIPGLQMSDNWVNNVQDWELTPDNTNSAAMVATGIGPYTSKAAALYRCPADNVVSDLQRSAGWQSRVRSYSMNAMVGDAGSFSQNGVNINNASYVQFFKVTSIPRPADIFVFLDEHPDSVDDGYFLNRYTEDSATWTDLPASFHNGGASFAFADGHSELHHWRNASTVQPAVAYGIHPVLPMPVANGQQEDYNWVISRMSVERSALGNAGSPPGSSPVWP